MDPFSIFILKVLIIDMKLIISEKQLKLIATYITESGNQTSIVKKIVKFLDSSYEPAIGTVKKGGEYHDKGMVKNTVNNDIISDAALLDYLKYKFEGLGDEFLKQVISDWFNGKLDKGTVLSKNVKTTA